MADGCGIVQRGVSVFTPAQHTYYNFAIAEGRGTEVISTDGKRYLDFSSGLAVLNLGHNHPAVVAAARAQLERFVHTGGIYYNESTVQAAEELLQVTPPGLDMLFFSNSGAEAVEGALKLARYTSRRQGIISFTSAFHGRTFGAVSVTSSSAAYRAHYHPLLPSVYQVPYPTCFSCPCGESSHECGTRCLDALVRLFEHQIPPEEVAAIIIEPFLGEGGYHPAPPLFLKGLRDICDQYGIYLIFDEVQSGIGRTGRWFAGEHAGVVPDIMTVGKAIASGFPLSSVISSKGVMDRWEHGCHGTTFGGNPVSCAAAVATLHAVRDEGLLERARQSGTRVQLALQALAAEHPEIGDVRGHGVMIGVEFVDGEGKPNTERCCQVLESAFRKGVILIPCGLRKNVVRFIPPMNVKDAELDEALEVFSQALKEHS
ncbi:aspartate aminotransferase family protein [Geomonas sp. RF6]|uniref:aspartate aminotransferase family protein n=1 Tax=Geomonas sp. RF6 TaxID=2897342 RepID=UPI001E4DB67E|nr:aspartate aminotransferase family protein [Geomonas sp. RF6]UFS69241.1 aspartate aminotransferase family protein [Geomonas sp. RF6]